MEKIIYQQHNNTHTYIIFLLSLVIHIIIFTILFFTPKKIIQPNTKQNIIYTQITSVSQTQPTAKKEPTKPKEVPKKPIIKKLIQQEESTSTKTIQKIPQPEVKPLQNVNTQSNDTPASNTEPNNELSQPVAEAVVDKIARCPTPDATLTQDAINAGVGSGKIFLEVIISAEGKVTQAKLLKGTGFQIDNEMIELAKKINCTPAQKEGKSVPVIKRLQWVIR